MLVKSKIERFSPDYTGPDTYVESVDTNIQDPSVLSHGTVQKYNNDGKFVYEFFFNLPDTSSAFQTTDLNKPFNTQTGDDKYSVYMGFDKKKTEMVGDLQRRSDGVHYFTLTSVKDYKFACVTLGKTLVDCVKL
jgi:hypothetical protein